MAKGIMEQIEDANVHEYKGLNIEKIEKVFELVFGNYWKPIYFEETKIIDSEIIKGPRKKLIINTKRD